MKRLLAFGTIALALAACGGNTDESKSLEEQYEEAKALADSGRHKEAAIEFIKIIRLGLKEDREWIKANTALGNSLFRLGLYDAAIESQSRVIKYFPDYPVPYSNRSWYLHAKGQYMDGIKDASKALELRPNYVQALNNRSLNYLGLGLYVNALQDADMAIQIDANHPEPYVNRATANKGLGRLLAACQDVTKARELGDVEIELEFPECLYFQ